MKKSMKTYLAAWVVLLAVFNVIAFVSVGWQGVEKYTGSFWAGYGFITLAFLGNLACAFVALKEDRKERLFLSVPMIQLSYTCLILSFVFGGACMLISPLPYFVGVILCAIVLGLYAIAVIQTKATVEAVSSVGEKVIAKTQFIRLLTVDAQGLESHAQSAEAKKLAHQVYEAVRYSDPMSCEALSVVEAKITVKMDELSNAIYRDDVAKANAAASELLILIQERNNKCKVMK